MLTLDYWYVPAAASVPAPVAATSAAVGTTEFTDMQTSTIRKVCPHSSPLAHCICSEGCDERVSAYPRARCGASMQIIAKKLLESKQTIPHYYLSIDCEMDALMR